MGKNVVHAFVFLAVLSSFISYYLIPTLLSVDIFLEQGERELDNDEYSSFSQVVVDTSLPALVKPSTTNLSCPEHFYRIEQVHNREADEGKGRKIPRIVHVTGKTRCLTKAFYDNVNKWKLENHSFYFHDDEAVDRLLFERNWPMFPQLKNAMECIKDAGGAAKADLWRLLVLWEYGGIYTDMDNAPAIYEAMKNVLGLEDIGGFYVPTITGPNVIKNAFLMFMGFNGDDPDEVKRTLKKKYAEPNAGTYIGKFDPNRAVTIAGNKKETEEWVMRDSVQGKDKNEGFKMMNITDYQRKQRKAEKKKRNVSCRLSLYKHYETTRY